MRDAFWELERHPSKAAALIDPAGRIQSYAALQSAADHAAERLPGHQRDIGFILFETKLAAVAIYLGALRSRRAVPLLIHGNVDAKLLNALIETYKPTWVAASLGTPLPEAYRPHQDFDGYAVHARWPASDGPAPHPDCGLLLSTSGSTGSPKLVRLSYSALAHNAASIALYLGLMPDDRAITTLPLAYSFGMSILNSHLAVGGSLTLTEHSLLTRDFWQVAASSGITSLSGVPSTYDMLRRAGIEKRGLGRLRALCQAGDISPRL